jgi:FkbM family methyltransferase
MSGNTMSALIYDIGLHDGGDTGHYLREGCRVVALDANPVMCAAAEANFRDYTQTGQLTVINCGVAEHEGQLEFWVCDDVSEWSSFHRDIASRNGVKHHAITVECVPIMDIVEKFGVADYMKIDIEGNDRICIGGLSSASAPKYISIEMDHLFGDQDIERLLELGYHDFKVICQSDSWSQVTTRNIWFYNRLTRKQFLPRCWRKLRRVSSMCLSGRRVGESGPWGEKTSGSWHSADHAHSVWCFLHELDEQLGTRGLGAWYDIHARK